MLLTERARLARRLCRNETHRVRICSGEIKTRDPDRDALIASMPPAEPWTLRQMTVCQIGLALDSHSQCKSRRMIAGHDSDGSLSRPGRDLAYASPSGARSPIEESSIFTCACRLVCAVGGSGVSKA